MFNSHFDDVTMRKSFKIKMENYVAQYHYCVCLVFLPFIHKMWISFTLRFPWSFLIFVWFVLSISGIQLRQLCRQHNFKMHDQKRLWNVCILVLCIYAPDTPMPRFMLMNVVKLQFVCITSAKLMAKSTQKWKLNCDNCTTDDLLHHSSGWLLFVK